MDSEIIYQDITIETPNSPQNYKVGLRLINYDDDGNELYTHNFKWMGIKQLDITEDIGNWAIEGQLFYLDTYAVAERKINSNEKISNNSDMTAEEKQEAKNKTFLYQNNCKDFLDIYIRQQFNPGQNDDVNKVELPDFWCLSGRFVVYDREDIRGVEDDACTRLMFCDQDLIKMKTIRPVWCTATCPENKDMQDVDPNKATDYQRSMYTGDAIKALLTTYGFKIDDKWWDRGRNRIFFSNYDNKTLFECIEFLLKHHTGYDIGDKCYLKKDYTTNKYTLISIYNYTLNAGNSEYAPGELQREHMFFQYLVGEDITTNPSVRYKAPLLTDRSYNVDIKAGPVTKYSYEEATPIAAVNSNIPIAVVNHNGLKQFVVDTKYTPDEIEKVIKEKYIPNFYTNNGDIITHYTKDTKEYQVFSYQYTPYTENTERERLNLAGPLSRKLFTSLVLTIGTIGMVFRHPGTFLGFDRNGWADNNYDNRLCGQWFITNVAHHFENGQYINQITGVKIHSFEKMSAAKA